MTRSKTTTREQQAAAQLVAQAEARADHEEWLKAGLTHTGSHKPTYAQPEQIIKPPPQLFS